MLESGNVSLDLPTRMVINTSPLIALVAALGDLRVLQRYHPVDVPFEVCQEILIENATRFAASEFEAATWLQKWQTPLSFSPMLLNSLDRGEAAVIQLALNENIQTVCIDESRARRLARLNGLSVTGSIGILLRAKREGYSFSMQQAIQRMQTHGIWLSQTVIAFALEQAGEKPEAQKNG
jgi:predicted nucleic acid-binding protein